MNQIREADWRVLSRLKPVALDRLCARILAELKITASEQGKSNHERYGKVYAIIEERDNKIGYIFNGLARSNALTRLGRMKKEELITDEELQMFSEETQGQIAQRLES